MAYRVGQQLGNYRLLTLLGEGSYAEVYLGQHVRLERQAAIKVLHTHLTEKEAEHFQQEAQIIARLEHPSIVRIFDFDVQDGVPFLVIAYAPNGSLRRRYPKGNILPLTQVVSYVNQVAAALQFAHDNKVIHRDVKPENMLLGRNEEILLSDFGLAALAHSTGSLIPQDAAGTLPYMAPEQIDGHPRAASDQYALGMVVYEWLCGARPFEGSVNEVMMQQMTMPPAPLHEKVATIPHEIEQVVLRALAKDRRKRFASVREFATALEQASQVAPAPTAPLPSEQSSPSLAAAPSYATVAVSPGQSGDLTEAILSADLAVKAPDTTVLEVPIQPPVSADTNQKMQIQQGKSHAPQHAPSSRNQQAHPSPSGSKYSKPRSPLIRISKLRNLILLVLVILLITSVAFFALSHMAFFAPSRTRTPVATGTGLPNGIGVTKAPDGEYIGISDGTFAFDTNRSDGRFKTQAAQRLKAGDVSGAESLWQSGLAADTNDAETFIYLEDQEVLASENPYITFVVGTMMTGDSVGVGRDDLQGAYVIQKEFNDGHKLPNNVELRLLIANAGNYAAYATNVAQQIVQAAQHDPTIVGVMGWPFSSYTQNAIGVLAKAHIPMVSQSASSDQLSGVSPYFFRVAPPNKGQAIAGARYAEQVLHAHNVALFVDPANSYSSTLAKDFSQQFTADGNHIVVTENYTVGSQGQGKLPSLLQDALSHNPDLIYFSGYSFDISVLLTNLPTTGQFASLPVLGGDALYELNGYSTSAQENFTRLRFTAFAYPDEWDIAHLTASKPPFFANYRNAFNPGGQHPGGIYGYTRPSSDVMLSYDATLALLTASKISLNSGGNGKSITPDQLRQGLTRISGSSAIQGVSGRIAFGPNGDPINKAFVILAVDAQGHILEVGLQGCFLLGSCN